MLRFNTFFTVIVTFFAFLLAFGGGLLTAIRLSTPPNLKAAPATVIEQEARPRPGQPSRLRASLTIPLDADHGLMIDSEAGEMTLNPPRTWRY